MIKTLTIIDTFGFFFRSFYALPQYLKTKDGFPTGLLTGFLNYISTLVKEHKSDYLIFAIDSKGATFREEIYKEYKANRVEPPSDLLLQLPIAISLIEKMGYKTLSKSGFEADDIIASVVEVAKKQNIRVHIVSHDKDLHQLIDDGRVVLVDAISKKVLDEDGCRLKYGVSPREFRDYQAIVGDTSDNVPGVKGIGKVGATKLINEFKNLETIYENIDKITQKSILNKLLEHKESAFLSRELVTLKSDIYDTLDFSEFTLNNKNPFLNIYDDLVLYEQNAILRSLRAKEEYISQSPMQDSKIVIKKCDIEYEVELLTDEKRLFEVVLAIPKDSIVAFDTETSGLEFLKDRLVGFSFCFDDKKAYYVPLAHSYLGVVKQLELDVALRAIREIFTHKVIGHNIKFDLHFIEKLIDDKLSIYEDTMVLSWLIDSSSKLSLDFLVDNYFSYKMISFGEVVKKGQTFADVALEDALKYAAEDAFMTLRLYYRLVLILEQKGLLSFLELSKNIETPFIRTLLEMEKEGIKVDIDKLKALQDEFSSIISSLTKDIYTLCGGEFNINSTQQLGKILFQKLNLTPQKKTKTGYSTDEETLSAIKEQHLVVPKLLEYREIYKLNSTYVEPLLALAKCSPKHRIHTSFLQVGTSTGRLSSSNPNLQNIPARGAFGLKIREAFIAERGKKLIGIDYSQIELRLLAHFSKDDLLVDSFFQDKDIHYQTSLMLFGESEARAKRDIAKTVNFGLLYGMGQRRLSQTLGIGIDEAKMIIERYFELFPSVKNYFRHIVDDSKVLGYTQTLLGRRRYFDYKNANQMQIASYEREAVNSVFQGSASDLIKLSMIKIDEFIKINNLNVKMLLQIHDELIFEADESIASEVGIKIREIMQNIYKLNIPLKATLNISDTWAGLK